jgi:hypothetical protein
MFKSFKMFSQVDTTSPMRIFSPQTARGERYSSGSRFEKKKYDATQHGKNPHDPRG